jgi:transformation/transcription domain-associated protein
VLWKVRELVPAPPAADAREQNGGELPARAVHGRVMELVEAACNPKNICRMEPTWHPWF